MPSSKKIIIGSRGSDLALWQANHVKAQLEKAGLEAEICIIKTKGDKIQDLPLDKLEGKGFFTKELEDALLNKEIDLAVHSHKDLPTESPKGLVIAAVSEREDPSELLLIHKKAVDEKQRFSLKQNAIVGTSSARRKSQLIAWRNDLQLNDLRGNVPTRIQKLRDGKYDAILIAYAGASRLELPLEEFHIQKLDPREFIPAPAQGVLALQVREDDKALREKLQKLNNAEVQESCGVERKILNLFDGGCQLPLGAYCEKEESEEGEIVYKVRVAKAEKWDALPKYFYFESKKTEGFAEKVVSKINGVTPGKVFISRDPRKNDQFRNCLEAAGYEVEAVSLIEIKQVIMRKFVKTDWVFFSSKHAVKHFFDQKPDVEGVKYGTVGKATAEELRKFGKRADFIGSEGDTRLTGKKFASLLGSKTVLFPQAKGSMKTIQLQLSKKENVKDVVVYETIKKTVDGKWKMDDVNVFVFTSPSNVDTYFETGKVSENQKVVAMGDATAAALKKYGVRANKQPVSFDDIGLLQAVFSL